MDSMAGREIGKAIAQLVEAMATNEEFTSGVSIDVASMTVEAAKQDFQPEQDSTSLPFIQHREDNFSVNSDALAWLWRNAEKELARIMGGEEK